MDGLRDEEFRIPIGERPAPVVCFHGFLRGKCLAPACENAPHEPVELRLGKGQCENRGCKNQVPAMRRRHGRAHCSAKCASEARAR